MLRSIDFQGKIPMAKATKSNIFGTHALVVVLCCKGTTKILPIMRGTVLDFRSWVMVILLSYHWRHTRIL